MDLGYSHEELQFQNFLTRSFGKTIQLFAFDLSKSQSKYSGSYQLPFWFNL